MFPTLTGPETPLIGRLLSLITKSSLKTLVALGLASASASDPVVEAEDWIKIQLVLDPDVEENNEGKPVEDELVRIKCSDSRWPVELRPQERRHDERHAEYQSGA